MRRDELRRDGLKRDELSDELRRDESRLYKGNSLSYPHSALSTQHFPKSVAFDATARHG